MLAEIAPADWYIDRGVLGVLLLLIVAAAMEYWRVRKPHIVAKLEAETEKERAQATLFARLSENHGVDLEIKRRQTTLLESIAENQEGHSRDCHDTYGLVRELVANINRVFDNKT